MTRAIVVHGVLAQRVGFSRIQANIETAAEAVRMLLANFPSLEALILAHDWRVVADGSQIGTEQLHHPTGSNSEIHFTPLICGAGGGGGRIIAGALLIGASFFVPGVALAGISLGPVMFGIGASLLLGGVSQLLTPKTPTQQRERKPTETRSYSVSGVQNTSRQGVPVNVPLGETIIGGIVISAGVTTASLPSKNGDKRKSQSYGSPRAGAGKGSVGK
jgi:predicted phage tail protein